MIGTQKDSVRVGSLSAETPSYSGWLEAQGATGQLRGRLYSSLLVTHEDYVLAPPYLQKFGESFVL